MGVHFCCVEQATPYIHVGELAERSIAAVLKTVVPLPGPGVRIPHSPLLFFLTILDRNFTDFS